jgi:5-methylcytosine-specific restriction endonuclease McrA
MPYAAPRICARCGQLVQHGATCVCRPPWEGVPQRAARGRHWTQLRRAKLRAQPICEVDGCRMLATTVDHITPLAENGAEYDWENLQSLCREHDIEKTVADGQRGKKRPRGEGT